MKRRSQPSPPITGTAQNIDEKRQERIERIAKELSKERTALELATGIDLAEHVLSGQTVAKAATDALATAATTANVERTALEIATGIELTDHAMAAANPENTFLKRFTTPNNGSLLSNFGLIMLIISIILFAIFGAMISGKIGPTNGNTESTTKFIGIILISILSATIVLYFVYLAFTNTKVVNKITNLYPTINVGISGYLVLLLFLIGIFGIIIGAMNTDPKVTNINGFTFSSDQTLNIYGVIVLNILLIWFVFASISNPITRNILGSVALFIGISFILWYMFTGWAILVNLFALFLFALLYNGSTGLYKMFTNWKSSTDDKIEKINYFSGIAIIIFTFIAILLGIFTLVFPPADYDPGNPDKAYSTIKNIIYVLVALIGLIIIGLIGKNWKIFPSILSSGVSYISKLIYSIIGIIIYMIFMTYFFNYGGLLTIVAKKTHKGTYDTSINPNTGKPYNSKSLNETVDTLFQYKNTAMIVLAPLSIIIGLYILYRGLKVESAVVDKTFDIFKKIMILILGIIFIIFCWKLDPSAETPTREDTSKDTNYKTVKNSEYHHTLEQYFSSKTLIPAIVIAIFGIIYALLYTIKSFASKPEDGSTAGSITSIDKLNEQNNKSPTLLITYVILYIIFIIIVSVGLNNQYFTPKKRYKDHWYTEPTQVPQDKGFGICPNNIEAKIDEKGSNCTPCKNTDFGCCDNGVTAKIDADGSNCEQRVEGKHDYYIIDGKKYDTNNQDNKTQAYAAWAIALIIIISIIWLGFILNEMYKLGIIAGDITKLEFDYVRKLFMAVSGVFVSSLIIYILVTSINGLTTKDKKKNKQGIMPFIVNLLTILIILGILYKVLKIDTNPKVNQTYHLVLDIIFYIPCLFITLYNNLPSTDKTKIPDMPNSKEFTQMTYIKILIGVIVLYIVYFYLFSFSQVYNNQDGSLILKDPIKLNTLTTLSGNLKLNKLNEDINDITDPNQMKFNYNYGMSFWLYLDSVNETQIDKYLTVLNYGDKPKVEYNPVQNIMRITVQSNEENKDAEPRVIYTLNTVLLQKWNNIIINYIGGTIDIFYNGELVASALNVSPYMSYDALTSGQDNGITGGICNLVYFTKSMTAKQIYYLYNILKDTSPPVMYDTAQTMRNIANNK